MILLHLINNLVKCMPNNNRIDDICDMDGIVMDTSAPEESRAPFDNHIYEVYNLFEDKIISAYMLNGYEYAFIAPQGANEIFVMAHTYYKHITEDIPEKYKSSFSLPIVSKIANITHLTKDGDIKGVVKIIEEFLCRTDIEYRKSFYDDIIESLNNSQTELKFKDCQINEESIMDYSYKRTLLSILKMCPKNLTYVNTIITYIPTIITYNLNSYSQCKEKQYKFIFHDIIFAYVNGLRESMHKNFRHNENDFECIKDSLEPLYKKCIEAAETRLEGMDNTIYSLKSIKATENAEETDKNILNVLNIYYKRNTLKNNSEYDNQRIYDEALLCPMDVTKMNRQNALLIDSILQTYDNLSYKLAIYPEILTFDSYMQDLTAFIGIKYEQHSYEDPITLQRITIPIAFDEKLLPNSDLLTTVNYWLTINSMNPSNLSWSFEHYFTRKDCNINDFRVNKVLRTTINKFNERSGPFFKYTDNYIFFMLIDEHGIVDIDIIAEFVIRNFFDGGKREQMEAVLIALKEGISRESGISKQTNAVTDSVALSRSNDWSDSMRNSEIQTDGCSSTSSSIVTDSYDTDNSAIVTAAEASSEATIRETAANSVRESVSAFIINKRH